MQIPPAGLGPPDPLGPSRLGGIQPPSNQGLGASPFAGLSQDDVGTLLSLLALPEIETVVSGIDRSLITGDHVATEKVLESAIAAAAEGNFPLAIAKVKELLTVNPEHAESIAANPSLRPIQEELVSLVRELKVAAKLDASEKMASAAHSVEVADQRAQAPTDLDPRMLLVLAMEFYNTDRLIGYLRSKELARQAVVLSGYRRSRAGHAVDMIERLRRFWSRAPMLVLLLGWLAFGWVPGTRIWALGFLALIGFHFVWRVRRRNF